MSRPPTERQIDYANSLVERLKEADQFNADTMSRRVAACTDIGEMSKHIDLMKKQLDDLKDGDKEAGIA